MPTDRRSNRLSPHGYNNNLTNETHLTTLRKRIIIGFCLLSQFGGRLFVYDRRNERKRKENYGLENFVVVADSSLMNNANIAEDNHDNTN